MIQKEGNDGDFPLGFGPREVLFLEELSPIDERQLSFFDGFRSISWRYTTLRYHLA